ncbi:MAG: DUF58 domain-containing protein [Pyrinomonadaceae bacterium]|nr:DUF58 domain-containing protein [Pyrinomonadaceae bacterium]
MSWLFSKSQVWIHRILSLLLLAGGVGAAFATVFARRAGDWETARKAALISLACVVLSGALVLPSLVRVARREGGLMDFPARPTIGGFIYLLVLFFVAYAAWTTGNNLLFLIFSVMLSALFVTWAAGRANLRDLMVGVRFSEQIFANEAAPVFVSLHNRKRWLPALSVLVKARHRRALRDRRDVKEMGAGLLQMPLVYFVYLSRRARSEQKTEIIFPQRGQVSILNFDLITHFPLNLFRLRRRFYARDMNLVVYPKPQPLDEELQLLPNAYGQLASMRRGAGHDLHSLRRYRPQDDLRHIDWKATARTRQLTVREWMAEMEPRVHIQLDTRIANEKDDAAARFEQVVTLAASLVERFISEGAKVRLTIGAGDGGGYGASEAHLYDCLHRLALVAPAPAEDDAEKHDPMWQHTLRGTAATTTDYTILLTAAPDASSSNLSHNVRVIRL